jgi:hypothetical protein
MGTNPVPVWIGTAGFSWSGHCKSLMLNNLSHLGTLSGVLTCTLSGIS